MASRLELAVRNTDRVVPLEPGQSVTAGRTPQCDVQLHLRRKDVTLGEIEVLAARSKTESTIASEIRTVQRLRGGA